MLKERVPRTGLEPARLAAHAPETCASTNSATWAFSERTQRPNALCFKMLSGKRDSDPRPQPWQGCALPTELFPQLQFSYEKHLSRMRMQRYDFFRNLQNFSQFFFKKVEKTHSSSSFKLAQTVFQLSVPVFFSVVRIVSFSESIRSHHNSVISSMDKPVYLAICSAGMLSAFIRLASSKCPSARPSARPFASPSARPLASPFLCAVSIVL